MGERRKERSYLLLDHLSTPLARARLEGSEDAPTLQFCVLDGKEDEVAEHEILQLVGMAGGVALQCRLLRRRGDQITLEKMSVLNPEDMRENLRVSVKFRSFIYPISGSWRGRREVRAADVSCGGIAFSGESGLEDGEQLEIVVPITVQPLVLRCEILRQQPKRDRVQFYAAKFVDLCDDEEVMVREAVFRTQLQGRSRGCVIRAGKVEGQK